MFCYEVIRDVYNATSQSAGTDGPQNPRLRRYLIIMKNANKTGNRGVQSSQIGRLVRFALDVLRMVLRKHDVLRTPANLKQFMPIVGDAIVSRDEDVQISAIRLLTAILDVPLVQIAKDAEVYATECIRIVNAASATNNELAQAAIKLFSELIRKRSDFEPEDKHIVSLLKKVKPDLEQPDRSGVTYNLLKAIISRRIVIPEVYEVVDSIATIMVANQDKETRRLARETYFQFLMEYPHGKRRLNKQLAFLVQNLHYKYKEGRQSVMEALHRIITKVGDDVIQDILGMVFLPLFMVMINDDDADCRKMAGLFLKDVFNRADNETSKTLLNRIRGWLDQTDNGLLRRAALQCWTIHLEVKAEQAKSTDLVLDYVSSMLREAAEGRDSAEWELAYYALRAFAKLCEVMPAVSLNNSTEPLWAAIRGCLFFPHQWVKLTAATAVGAYLRDFLTSNVQSGFSALPLSGSGGLVLEADNIRSLVSSTLRILRVPGVSEELCAQAIRNLGILGRLCAASNLQWRGNSTVADEAGEDDDGELSDDEASAKTVLQYIFERLSNIIRHESAINKAAALYPKTASLQLIAALCNSLPVDTLKPCLTAILQPLSHLTDPAILPPHSTDATFRSGYEALQSTAQEILALLQKRMGTTEFINEKAKVEKAVRERREERRVKRRLEAVSDPVRDGERKRRKHDAAKIRRKEKSAEERGKRRGW